MRSPYLYIKPAIQIIIVLQILKVNMKLQVILEPSDEGGYTVYVPALPGCISEGDDVNEALENIQEAIELYLEPVETDIVGNQDLIVRELTI